MGESVFDVTGVAAILAALGILGSYWLTEERKERYPGLRWWAYVGNNFMLMLAFFGMYVFFGPDAGALGYVGFVAAALGSVVTTYPEPIGGLDGYQIGSGLFGLGIALAAIVSYSTGSFPPWLSGVWAASIVLGIPGMVSTAVRTLSYFLGGLSFSLGLLAAGYFMLLSGIG